MTKSRIVTTAWLLLSVAIGCLFVYAGVTKLVYNELFRTDILRYRILYRSVALIAAVAIPLAEIAGGAMMLIPRTRIAASYLLLFLMAMFVGAIVHASSEGIQLSCGCFGAGGPDISPRNLLYRDAVVILLILAAYFRANSQRPQTVTSRMVAAVPQCGK
jgi:uncharacterized membrane protein YphA (DoxX/SURF4 family)